jgi:hypothetical protein
VELPEASETAAQSVSHSPSIAAMAPRGCGAASSERLAAFTMPVAIGSPESTLPVTGALAFSGIDGREIDLVRAY